MGQKQLNISKIEQEQKVLIIFFLIFDTDRQKYISVEAATGGVL